MLAGTVIALFVQCGSKRDRLYPLAVTGVTWASHDASKQCLSSDGRMQLVSDWPQATRQNRRV